ncbi:carbonic anhydrase 1-like isoform X2 [Cimex lectularius]|uniref:Carbonic anhydrase n=1 Tax=Cimex lectularius TaxID=79782 RepID=A0A8I6RHV4_CIMLE|nr:carbonic anhydrase 1-like isoform X2 [Cimex lectularius]
MPPKKSITGAKKSIAKKSISGKKKSISGKKKSSIKGSRKSIKGGKGKRGSKGRKSMVGDLLSELPEYNAENVRDAMHEMETAESPINLTLGILKKIRLPPINWYNYDLKAHAMKLSNTAYSVVLTGLWGEHSRPFINGGPFLDDYEFSQIHFHWGQSNSEGSEHTVDGVQFPFELHAVFYRKLYESHERAKAEEDGIAVLVYLFKLAQTTNVKLQPITDSLPSVVNAYTDASIDPVPLISLIKNIIDDYILYLGVMKYKCAHGVLWLICRDTFGITEAQLGAFRLLQDRYNNPMPKSYRDVQELQNRIVFLCSPSKKSTNLLYPYVELTKKGDKKRSKSKKGKKGKGKGKGKGGKNKRKGTAKGKKGGKKSSKKK